MAGYLGSTPVPQATQHRESFTCTEGQTSFATAGYTPQFLDVFLNGSHLSPADFVATNSSDVVLVVAASADDICDIVSYTPFEVADQTFTGNTIITNGDNTAQLELISTDTDQSAGPRFDMYRNPGEAGADSDNIGQVNFFGLNDASEKTQFVYLATEINDAANGSEDSRFTIGALVAGADSSIIEYTQATPATGADPELVVNNTSRDINFRVESDDYPYCLFVNSTEDNVAVGWSAEPLSQTPGLVVLSEDQSGGVVLIKEDGSQPSSGEGLGSFGWQGSDDTNSMNAADARITAFAAENFDGSNAATFMSFYTKTTSQGPGNGPTEVFRLTQAGEAIVQTGDLYFATAGKGIVLGATTNVAANTLDDYEEANWTPKIFVGTTEQNLSRADGTYVKVGDFVHCAMAIIVNGNISGTGAVTVTNFPFTAFAGGSSGNARAAGSVAYTSGTFMPIGLLMGSNTNIAAFYGNSTKGTTGSAFTSSLQHGDLPANWNMHFSVSYRTT